jgi:hypothetical protein
MERAERDGAVKLVKIDTEGAEVDILEGVAADILAKGDQFVLEYHNALLSEAHARCEAALVRAGFRCAARKLADLTGLGLLYATRPS